MLKRSVGFVLILSVGLLFSCKDKKDNEGDDVDFNKAALLENTSENIIIPSLMLFQSEINDLKASFDNFENNPSQANLDEVKLMQILLVGVII